jgi:ABC-2 type transport system permease protein
VPAPDAPAASGGAAGTIYDIGYRRYEGPRLGRGYAFRTLFAHSFRTAWGLGRGGRALTVPWGVLAIVSFPALLGVVVAAISQGDARLFEYEEYFVVVQFMVALYCAAQAPELVSTDQQHRVLPLYFSRALRRLDYAAARLAAMVASVFLLLLLPQAILFVGQLALTQNVGAALRAEGPFILPILGSCLLAAVVLATVSMALASLTRRRAIASASILGLFLVTVPVAGILDDEASGNLQRAAPLFNPLMTIFSANQWMFPDRPKPPPTAQGDSVKADSASRAAKRDSAKTDSASKAGQQAQGDSASKTAQASPADSAAKAGQPAQGDSASKAAQASPGDSASKPDSAKADSAVKAGPRPPPKPRPKPLPGPVYLAAALALAALSAAGLFTRYARIRV